MTQRLYYDDSYTTNFAAHVVERLTVDGRPAVVLDRTYFYPEGGGQPADRGTINGLAVVGVMTRADDHAVIHVLEQAVSVDEVSCCVDWAHRFDHMQHHTGQHILTQAFVQVAGAHTVGFHLGGEHVTIDLDRADIPFAVLDQVEDLANRVVTGNRPVTTRIVDPADTDQVRIRRMPEYLTTGGLRIVEIADFDQTACGGTHVAHTGEIGLIKITRLERYKGGTRVEFLCGGRALRDYRDKHTLISHLAADLTVGQREIDQAVERLKAELKVARQALSQAQSRLTEYEASELYRNATLQGDGLRIVQANFSAREVGELRALVSSLVRIPNTIALLGLSGDSSQLILARSENLPHDMRQALKEALETLGGGRGGGRPDFVQGGGIPADAGQIEAALQAARAALLASAQ